MKKDAIESSEDFPETGKSSQELEAEHTLVIDYLILKDGDDVPLGAFKFSLCL